MGYVSCIVASEWASNQLVGFPCSVNKGIRFITLLVLSLMFGNQLSCILQSCTYNKAN